ncbi:MAG TPA: amino acid ABC transporter permease [Eoetvoesiella sp.]
MDYQFDFSFLAEYWPVLLEGVWLTIQLATVSIILGFLVGAVFAVARISRFALVRVAAGIYIEVVRNTPLLVQMFIIFFGLSSLGMKLSANTAAVLALVINTSAYTCEIVRAGLESIRKGQLEAAHCLALTKWQVLRKIVFPPAIENVWPALTSQFILLMLTTSVTSQISAEELTSIASRVDSTTFRSFEIYIVVAGLYLGLSFLFRFACWLIGQAVFVRRRRLGPSI